MNKKISIAVFIIAILFAGFLIVRSSEQKIATDTQPEAIQSPKEVTASLGTIKSAQLNRMLQHKDFFFINVHIPYEGEIANTDVFIPYDTIASNLDKLPKDKSAKIVLYCRSGRMSEIAGQTLAQLGYTSVSHLSGGMNSWEESGYKLIKK